MKGHALLAGEQAPAMYSPWPQTLRSGGARLGYLGPAGTWTHQACLQWQHAAGLRPGRCGPQLLAMTAPQALQALVQGEVDGVCLPVSTCLVGATPYLPPVLAMLAQAWAGSQPLQVVGECRLQIGYSLMARPGVALAQLQAVYAHPVALQEAQVWLQQHLPALAQQPAASAGAAAQMVAASHQKLACLGPALAASLHGLAVLQEGIEQGPHNETRWWLLAAATLPPSAVADVQRPWLGRFALPGALSGP